MNKSAPETNRKLRTRTLIQLGGLIEKAGILEHLGLNLGDDLQKDVDVKEAMITLFGALIDMKETVLTDPDQKYLCLLQGKQAFLESASLEHARLEQSRLSPVILRTSHQAGL